MAHQPLEAGQAADIEDFGMPARPLQPAVLISTKRKRVSQEEDSQVESQDLELTQSWREILGPPPPMGKTRVTLFSALNRGNLKSCGFTRHFQRNIS